MTPDPTSERFKRIEVEPTAKEDSCQPTFQSGAAYSERFIGKDGPWDETLDVSELASRLSMLAQAVRDGSVKSVCISYVNAGHWIGEDEVEVNIAPK